MSIPTRNCPKCECNVEMEKTEFSSPFNPEESEPGWECPKCGYTETYAEYKDSRDEDDAYDRMIDKELMKK